MSGPADAVYRPDASRCEIWAGAEQTPRTEVNPSNLNAEDRRLVGRFWENGEHLLPCLTTCSVAFAI